MNPRAKARPLPNVHSQKKKHGTTERQIAHMINGRLKNPADY